MFRSDDNDVDDDDDVQQLYLFRFNWWCKNTFPNGWDMTHENNNNNNQTPFSINIRVKMELDFYLFVAL